MMNRKTVRGLWRLLQPIRYNMKIKNLIKFPNLYWNYLREWKQFVEMGGEAPIDQLMPCLFDKNNHTQSGGGHYFYQDIWALNKLAELKPIEHHDVGSRFDGFVGQATAIAPIVSWDIRQPSFNLPKFEFRHGNILELPVPDRSIQSLSCLNVAEHIGLGRYGDSIDSEGTLKAMKELQRVIADNGKLLFSIPVGQNKTYFNAHRVLHPLKPLEVFDQLKIIEFSIVDENENFIKNVDPNNYVNSLFATGLYHFERN